MTFRFPEADDREILREYVREHLENGETDITAGMGLETSEFAQWLEKIRRNAESGDEAWGRSLLFLCFDRGRLIGLLSVRYELPGPLSEIYGDVGYGVRPSERRKGYATAMLRYGLSVCREKGMEKALLGCYKDNLGSAATIRKNGGVLVAENDNYTKGKTSQYYEIIL